LNEKTGNKSGGSGFKLGPWYKRIPGRVLNGIAGAAGPFSSIVAIVIGLLVGFIVLIISNPANAFFGIGKILGGGLGSSTDFGNVLYFATPIIMTGLSVSFAFRTNLFNIGASGQFIMGALGAVFVGVYGTGLGSFQWIAALLAAMLMGALWAVIPGLLQAYRNVNIVISCIMTNYIGTYFVNMTVRSYLLNTMAGDRALGVAETANIPKFGLDKLFPGSMVGGGIIIAIILAVVIHIILSKTTFGFELKACGFNRYASRYAGINEKRCIVLSMVISGALAGIGGGLMYLAGSGKYILIEDVIAPEGFTGISVALLGMSHPIGTLFAGLFIGYITQGGSQMQLAGYVPEIVDIITAVIIYFAAFALVLRSVLQRIRMKRGGDRT
jgi:ABC-type uncharacterized transport system permease subunit